MTAHQSGGGAAAHAGITYQDRVEAWIADRVLAEKDSSAPWDLPASTTLDFLRCETDQPVDDVLVGLSNHGHAFLQAKHTLSLGTTVESEFASVVDQFVRQYLARRGSAIGPRSWDRPLDPANDRLVLVVGPASSGPLRETLPAVLAAVRGLSPTQPICDAASNDDQRHVFRVLKEHVTRAWRNAKGVDPIDDEMKDLLRTIRVQTLDVDSGGDQEREAKDLLRTAVLKDPTQADLAWSQLTQVCADFGRNHSGADRSELQRILLSSGIGLQAVRSYRDDIERLRNWSHSTANSLSQLSTIRVGNANLKVSRTSTSALRHAADGGSLVVVSEPGAGKSGALYDLSEILRSEGRDVVLFAVDQLEAASLGSLRNEIGLGHELIDVLSNWPGTEPAFLIIDALDAARSDAGAKTLRELIASALGQQSRWHVIVSIRKYDLRYSSQLQSLFAGAPPTDFQDPQFVRVRHFRIPQLSDAELQSLSAQSKALADIFASANPDLRELLRVLFNVRLAGELAAAGVPTNVIAPIRTQIELLTRYWEERIIGGDGRGDAREAVLRLATEAMVAARSLRVERAQVSGDPSANDALRDLLSSQMLVEWQPSPDVTPDRYTLAFQHHILFDYAVSRLVLTGPPESLLVRLQIEPDLAVAIRPSLVFHFQALWIRELKHSGFWELALRFFNTTGIPAVGRIIAPCVASQLMSSLSDCEVLTNHLADAQSPVRPESEELFRHLVGAVGSGVGLSIAGEHVAPWCDLLERVSVSLRRSIVFPIRFLLHRVCEKPDLLTNAQRSAAGATARRLLAFALSEAQRDSMLVGSGIECVCRTYESDPVTSSAFLRTFLQQQHLEEHGHEDMPVLAGEVKRLVTVDPDFVRDVYRAAFGYRETRTEETPIGNQRIIPLRSTKRQDYDQALWQLGELFPEFLDRAPEQAIEALVFAVRGHVDTREASGETSIAEESFDFSGASAAIREDGSHIWDSIREHRYDPHLKMLDALEAQLRGQGASTDESVRKHLVAAIVHRNNMAAIWRRLLICGKDYPDTFGKQVRSLAWASPVLRCTDTTKEVGDFLSSNYAAFSNLECELTERAILNIPDAFEEDDRSLGQHIRDRLLGCLPANLFVTDDANRVLREIEAQGGPPPNPSQFEIISSVEEWAEEDLLSGQGVRVESEPNRKLNELIDPIRRFAGDHSNEMTTPTESQEIIPQMRSLHAALATATADGIHQKLSDQAWGYLAAACARIAAVATIDFKTDLGVLLKDLLLEASTHGQPSPDPDRDARFDDFPSWGSPAARIDATRGLVLIARFPECIDKAITDGITRLSLDPVPAVRFQIAGSLRFLCNTAADTMWEIIQRMAEKESSSSVLLSLVNGTFDAIAGANSEKIAGLTKVIFERPLSGKNATAVRQGCTTLLLSLFLWKSHTGSERIVREIASRTSDYPDEASQIVASIRKVLVCGDVEIPNVRADSARTRAFELLRSVLHSSDKGLRILQRSHSNVSFPDWPEGDKEKAKTLGNVADMISRQIYFASGAFEAKRKSEQVPGPIPSVAQRLRLLREAGPLIDDLSVSPLPSVIHHVLETLEYLLDLDPKGVFLRIAQIVQAGKTSGYQYESLAVNLIVRVVERFLADYRPVMRESQECRVALVLMLDIFVDVGWTQAIQLTYRLDEIFR